VYHILYDSCKPVFPPHAPVPLGELVSVALEGHTLPPIDVLCRDDGLDWMFTLLREKQLDNPVFSDEELAPAVAEYVRCLVTVLYEHAVWLYYRRIVAVLALNEGDTVHECKYS
jgi:hypothetical protein